MRRNPAAMLARVSELVATSDAIKVLLLSLAIAKIFARALPVIVRRENFTLQLVASLQARSNLSLNLLTSRFSSNELLRDQITVLLPQDAMTNTSSPGLS